MRLPPNVYSVFGWRVPRFIEAVQGVRWPRHSWPTHQLIRCWPSHRVTRCNSPASLGRTDVEELTQAGRVGHWYAGLVLLNNHPSQLIRQSAAMPLPLISSRLLKHHTTRSSNAGFVCRAELFCSRCQTRVFLIHSLKRGFQLLCRRRNQRQPQVTTTSMWNSWRTWVPQLTPGCPNFSSESWLHIPSRRSGERPRW